MRGGKQTVLAIRSPLARALAGLTRNPFTHANLDKRIIVYQRIASRGRLFHREDERASRNRGSLAEIFDSSDDLSCFAVVNGTRR